MNKPVAILPTQCIGLIGLGLVGTALAKRLSAAGYQCIGFDTRKEAMQSFEDAGFQTCASVSLMLNQTNTLILAVFDTSGVIAVVGSVKEHRKLHKKTQSSHLSIIDCSTGDPVKLAKLAHELAVANIHFIEAPLSGSSVQIESGQATMLLGGHVQDIENVSPILDALTPSQMRVGGAGMAAKAKLATNLVLGLNRTALAEGMVFAQTLGIQPETFLQLVLNTPARSEAAVIKGDMMVNEQFEPQSRIRQHLKDVQLMLDIADQNSQSLPLSQTHAQLMRNAIAQGDGELDNAAIIRQIRREKKQPSPKK